MTTDNLNRTAGPHDVGQTFGNTASSMDKCATVLAIDDNEDFRNLIRELLEPSGFKVLTAANAVKALELYAREKNSIELVLLDFYMPDLDGAKTFEWLRKLNPKVKVIICSGADSLRLRQLQAQHAIDGLIHKPFRSEEAIHVIREVMANPVRSD